MKTTLDDRYIRPAGNAIQMEIVSNSPLPARAYPMELRCPKCGSTDLKKVSLVYEEGSSRIKTKSRLRGWSFGDDGPSVFVGTAETKGVLQTGLSERLQPPQKWSYVKPIGWCAATCLVLLIMYVHSVMGSAGKVSSLPGMVVTVAIGGLFLSLMFATWRHNRLVYPRQHESWAQSFVCLRCGGVTQGSL
jgi:hypothetical protein